MQRTATHEEWATIVANVAERHPEHAKVLAAGRTTFTRDGETIAPPPSLAETQPQVLMTSVVPILGRRRGRHSN